MRLAVVLIAVVSARAELRIQNAVVHQYEDGPPAGRSYAFRAGEPVNISFQVSGYKRPETGKIQVFWEATAEDAEHRPLAPPESGKVEAELAPEDKDWAPKIRYRVTLPTVPEPGMYRILLKASDGLSGETAQSELPFMVEAPAVPKVDSVSILNFQFLRSENAPVAGSPVFRPGDTVWARFIITGYKFAEKNRYDVRYGVALKDASGKELFSEPNAATDSQESFYPRRHIDAALNIKLDPQTSPGEYHLVITVADQIAGQQLTSDNPFRVDK